MPPLNYRPDIDGLRAIAIISVVVFHLFPEIFPGGFIGVDIFFVVSGYLISLIIFKQLRDKNFSLTNFYKNRILRIFPALILILISSWVVAWFTLLPEEFKQLGKHILGGTGFIANFMLWGESGYFDSAAEVKPLLHLWSLGIEEQFYLFWPVFLIFFWKRKISIKNTLCVLISLSFLLNAATIQRDPVGVFYSPLSRCWELFLGALVAWTVLQENASYTIFLQKKRNQIAMLGLILILSGFVCISTKSIFPGFWALLPVLGTCFLILASSRAWLNENFLSQRLLVWFGLISYPLYLWHWPLMAFTKIIQGEVQTFMRISILVLSIFLAWATYQFIEKPVRNGFNKSIKCISLTLILMVTGYMGYAAYIRDGIPIQRIYFRSSNPLLNEILTYKFYSGAEWRNGTCFLNIDQDFSAFRECSTPIDKNKKSIYIWGDSHAAHLYPGMKEIYGAKYNLIQRNASDCAPLVGVERKNRLFCKSINDQVLSEIKQMRPDKLILAANWSENNWRNISQSIKEIQKTGVTNIYIVGPVPAWKNDLPKQIYLYCKKNQPCSIPQYMTYGLNTIPFQVDNELHGYVQKLGVTYISAIKILCNDQGCLIRTGDSGNTITAFDVVHLTTSGSIYLVSKLNLD
jgi:peptidoglycan/LPS O-acetylase OafA/YrhL